MKPAREIYIRNLEVKSLRLNDSNSNDKNFHHQIFSLFEIEFNLEKNR